MLWPQADEAQEFSHSFRLLPFRQTMQGEGFSEHVAHRHARVERAVRVLENDLHLAPKQPYLALREAEEIPLVEPDLARCRLDQAQRSEERRVGKECRSGWTP